MGARASLSSFSAFGVSRMDLLINWHPVEEISVETRVAYARGLYIFIRKEMDLGLKVFSYRILCVDLCFFRGG